MTLFFILNNLHFTLELLGAVVFFALAWLAFDAFLLRFDKIMAFRGTGYVFLMFMNIVHAFDFRNDLAAYSIFFFYAAGIFLILLSFLLEKPLPRPEFKAVLVLPAFGALIAPFSIIETLGLCGIAYFAYRQYSKEFKVSMKHFWIGFLFLAAGALTVVFYKEHAVSGWWIVGHLLEIAGFISLTRWMWHYLQLRVREEMMLIFTSFSLLMATIVTLAFSTILITRVEANAKANLLTNSKVLEYATLRLKEESLAKAAYLAGRSDIKEAFLENDFNAVETVLTAALEKENLGFLILADKNGEVIVRAHALTQKGDSVAEELAAKKALTGDATVAIEKNEAEKFSIRAAAPIFSGKKIVGVIIAGFPLDNALVDSIKRITGLEMSIFDGAIRVATTAINPDGYTRSIGIQVTDPLIIDAVLKNGKTLALRTEILSQPFLAAFVPIFGADQKIIGMLSSAESQQEILNLTAATNRMTFVTVMALLFILIAPLYFVIKKISQEMES